MTKLMAIACLWTLPAWAVALAPSADTSDLKPLLDKEAQLVQTVRTYDLQQKALADWDIGMSKRHEMAGEAALAEEKVKQAQRRYTTIQTMYEEVLKRYPSNARALNYYGENLYDHGGNEVKAIESWKMATTLDPKLALPLNNLAIHYCHTGDFAEGLRCFDQALKLEPENPDFLYNLAQNYLIYNVQIAELRKWPQEKIYHEAMKASKRAAELSPESFELNQDYAVNFFAADRFNVTPNWADAAAAWEKTRAVSIFSHQVFYTWLNEGRVWKRALKKDKAVHCLQEALKLQPDSDVTKNLLAEVESSTAVQEKRPSTMKAPAKERPAGATSSKK